MGRAEKRINGAPLLEMQDKQYHLVTTLEQEVISIISRSRRKFSHLISVSGMLSPIINGKSRHKHHIWAAVLQG